MLDRFYGRETSKCAEENDDFLDKILAELDEESEAWDNYIFEDE